MSKKHGPRNAFYFFMLDFKEQQERAGRRYIGIKEVMEDPKCSEQWKVLDRTHKGVYEKMAKEEKFRVRGLDKQTGTGESVEQLERMQRELAEFKNKMMKYLDRTLASAVEEQTIAEKTFYIVHVNYFYKKEGGLNVVDYAPAEFAISRFSLKNGVEDVFHKIMHHKLPLGYKRMCLEHSEESHQIPDEYSLGEQSYKIVYNQLLEFICPNGNTRNLPPLYTDRKNTQVAQSLIKKIAEENGRDLDFIYIYSLEALFSKLYTYIHDPAEELNFNITYAENEFVKDVFMYAPHIECEFHENSGRGGVHCSKSQVQRWAYVVCDHICQDMGIELVEGQHAPWDKNMRKVTSRMQKVHISVPKVRVNDATNVTEEHRIKVTSRTYAEEQKQLAESKPLLIIDYSKENPEAAINHPAPSTSRPPVQTNGTRAWGLSSNSAPPATFNIDDDTSFPSISGDSSSRGTSSTDSGYNSNFPQIGGRGRGGRGRGRGSQSRGRGRGKNA